MSYELVRVVVCGGPFAYDNWVTRGGSYWPEEGQLQEVAPGDGCEEMMDENGVISQLLYFGHGEMFSAIISSVRLDQHPENMVHMIVYVTDARKAAGAGDPVF